MKKCKHRAIIKDLPNGIFVCNLLHSPVCCPTDDTKCFNTLNIEEE